MTRLEAWLLGLAALGVVAAGLLLPPASAPAAETINYSYDARGRLIKVVRTGTVNHNVNSSYSYDKADNRTNKTVTGAPK